MFNPGGPILRFVYESKYMYRTTFYFYSSSCISKIVYDYNCIFQYFTIVIESRKPTNLASRLTDNDVIPGHQLVVVIAERSPDWGNKFARVAGKISPLPHQTSRRECQVKKYIDPTSRSERQGLNDTTVFMRVWSGNMYME